MPDVPDVKNMMLRKLEVSEHWKTRELWEKVFTEDTQLFLDYYYSEKTKENEIYVIEMDDKIVSMVHLNPYQMRIGEQVYMIHYIVAVATDSKYRKQGLMRQLLTHVMKVMEERGEPFTFLMPADEAIYKPFGFQYIYHQTRGYFQGKNLSLDHIKFCDAEENDCEKMAQFANACLKEYDIVTHRTEAYYRMILKEQTSENGGILLAKSEGEIIGIFCYAKEEQIEIREPLFLEESVLKQAIFELTKDEETNVLCIGAGDEQKPMIMAKVFHSCPDINLLQQKVFLNEVV